MAALTQVGKEDLTLGGVQCVDGSCQAARRFPPLPAEYPHSRGNFTQSVPAASRLQQEIAGRNTGIRVSTQCEREFRGSPNSSQAWERRL